MSWPGVTLGSCLRELRVSDPYLKLRELAKLIGIHPATLSHYESDREKPSPEMVRKLADALGADADALLPLLDSWQEAPPLDLSQSICNGRRIS